MATQSILMRLLSYARPYTWQFLLGTFLVLISGILTILPPLLIGALIDTVFTQEHSPLFTFVPQFFLEQTTTHKLITFAVLFFIIRVLTFVLDWGNGYWLASVGQKVLFDMRLKLFSYIHSLSLNFFQQNPVGRLVTRTTSDVAALEEVFSVSFVSILKDFAIIVCVSVVLILVQPTLGLITLAVLPVIFLAMALFRVYSLSAYQKWRAAISQLNTFLAEALNGIRVVHLFGLQPQNVVKFSEISAEYREHFLSQRKAWAIYRPTSTTLQALAITFILAFGGSAVLSAKMTLGLLVSFLAYAELLFWPIRDLSERLDVLQNAMTSAERIFALLDTKQDLVETQQAIKAPIFNGKVDFEHVSFGYQPTEPVLTDIHFTVSPGQSLALVGATGAGKTTIVALLSRFYDVNMGTIRIDDQDIRQFTLESLRRQIAVVHQDVFLFSGTVLENIRLGDDENISEQKVKEACTTVGIDAMIQRLPKGYATEVAEGGKTFSVGERQLLSFARALAFEPRILILDEATANIDTHSEERIQKALAKLIQGRTSIIVAHRLSTIQKADCILVLQHGKIIEQGTHQSLLKQQGMYAQLYRLHFEA